jgi:hypothetical protein
MNPSISLFYDYDPDGQKRPVWLSINFGFEGIPWIKKSLYLSISKYDEQDIYNFHDEYIGCSVFLDELLASPNDREIGINLAALNERLKATIDPILIDRLIIQVVDAVEVGAISKEMF